jgi:lipoprotein LprG
VTRFCAWQAGWVRRTLRWLVVTTLLAGVLSLAACSGDDGADDAAPSLRPLLVSAKQQLDQTPGVRFVLSTDSLPEGLVGLLEAKGVGTHAPAFQGDIKVAQGGFSVNAEVVAVDAEVYAKISFSPVFIRIDPAEYGAPDPAALMDRETGVSALLTAATALKDAGERRDGAEVLRSVDATIPGESVAAIFPSASMSPFRATFELTSGNQLRHAEIRGPFYGGRAPVTYTIDLDSYGERVEISPP